ncbi:MAG TPA: thioredoxin domain-containing protein [Panacibacter sp.]|nr:thioredoxin domain-containing protein [Panacibacter sp.]
MKYATILLAGIILFSCNAPAQNQNVNAEKFQQHAAEPGVQILDVRTTREYQNGHIKKALQADWLQQDQFKDRIQYLDKTKPVLVYCASGGRSGKAAEWLAQNGFQHIENLEGGFTQWKLENKPVEGMENVIQLTTAEYEKYTKADATVLVDFGAEWCPPCKLMAPVIDAVENELKNKFKLVKVDGGVNTEIMKQLNVAALPTFIVYKNGKEVWRKQGVTEKAELIKQLQ